MSTTEETNIEILRPAYAGWNESKGHTADQWMGLIADDVRWNSITDGAPGMEFTACRCTKNEVQDYLRELAEEWELLHYTVNEFIAQGDRVVVLSNCAWQHRRTGKCVESPKADILTMRDGKIVEFFELFDTAKAFAATQ